MEIITAKTNEMIKDTKKLMTSASHRAARGLFVLEGARLCFDVLHSVYTPEVLLLTEHVQAKYPDEVQALLARSARAFLISEDVAAKLADTKTAQGIFAVCRMPQPCEEYGARVIALDTVQDPANMGAVIRSAEALGMDTVLTAHGCDIYNPKVLRASMGGVLRQRIVTTEDLPATLQKLSATHRIYATVPDSAAVPIHTVDFSVPSVCIIGNEANGVSEAVKQAAHALITIPMNGRAESLNAAAAAAITMWEMVKD